MGDMMSTPKPPSKEETAAESLLKRAPAVTSLERGAGHAVPWDTIRSKAERLAALPPLPAPGSVDAAPTESLAHNPAPAADRRGAFVEQGNAGRSRVNRSGHKP